MRHARHFENAFIALLTDSYSTYKTGVTKYSRARAESGFQIESL